MQHFCKHRWFSRWQDPFFKRRCVATHAKSKVEELTKKLLENDDDSHPFDDIEVEEDEDKFENNEIVMDDTLSDCDECYSQDSSEVSSAE